MRSPVGELVSAVGSAFGALARPRNDAPVPYVARRDPAGRMGAMASSDQVSQLSATGTSGTLFSIINRLSVDTSAVGWHMHRITHQRSGATCPECDMPGVSFVDKHPLLSVWNKPNDFFTRQEFVETVQQHIDLTGEGWFTVSRAGGRPIELWPVRPDRMAPVRDPKTYLNGYVYRAPDGTLIPLRLDEVIFMRMPNPSDPYRGMGAVQSLINQLWGAKMAAEWNRRFFENSALPGGLIELPNHLSDPEWEEFQDRWGESHRGVNNAHTVGLLEYGGKWVDLKYTQKDMEFSELRRVTREEIREAFGIHGHMLGLSEDVNRANAEASETTYAKRQLVPRVARWAGALNSDLLPMFGDMGKGYEVVADDPVPENEAADNAERESKANAFKTLTDAGVHPDDAALICGLPPVRMIKRAPAPIPVPAAPAPAGLGAPIGVGS